MKSLEDEGIEDLGMAAITTGLSGITGGIGVNSFSFSSRQNIHFEMSPDKP